MKHFGNEELETALKVLTGVLQSPYAHNNGMRDLLKLVTVTFSQEELNCAEMVLANSGAVYTSDAISRIRAELERRNKRDEKVEEIARHYWENRAAYVDDWSKVGPRAKADIIDALRYALDQAGVEL